NFHQTFGKLERRLHGIVEATAILGAHDEPVNDDRDVVIHAPIELRRIRNLDELPVDDGAHESLLARGLEELAELAFASADERREDLQLGSFRPGEDGIRDLSGALALHWAS